MQFVIDKRLENIKNMENNPLNGDLFSLSLYDLQCAAKEKFGRELSEEEIHIAKKGIHSALMFDLDTVYNTVFSEMI
jgi:hypothetical protein